MNPDIRILDQSWHPHWKDEIIRVRKSAFHSKYKEQVDLRGLEWNETDEGAWHFGALVQDQLASVLRLTLIENAEQFESQLRFPASHPFSSVPCYNIARLATSSEHGKSSLNMWLRREAYRFIVRSTARADRIYGTALSAAARLPFLKSLGYEILVHRQSWQGFFKSEENPIAVFYLPTSRLQSAIGALDDALK